MASDRVLKLRRIYGIALSCVTVVAGICLMVACVGIYLSGDEPFSREAVAAAFAPIRVPVYLCLAMVVAGFVLSLLCPLPAEKAAGAMQYSVLRNRLLAKADLEHCSEELHAQILAEQTRRKKNSRICTAVLAVCAVVFLIYALNGTHFHASDINSSMIRAMFVLLPCLTVSLTACIWLVIARKKSMLHEIELLKQCPKASVSPAEAPKPDHTKKVRNVLLAAAIALVIFGFVTGGTADVLTKAVNICTECIGLG